MDTGSGTRVPPRYADDHRVSVREAGGFTATRAGITFYILYSEENQWMVCLAPSEQPMQVAGGYFARFIKSAPIAIAAAIGDPIPAAVAA